MRLASALSLNAVAFHQEVPVGSTTLLSSFLDLFPKKKVISFMNHLMWQEESGVCCAVGSKSTLLPSRHMYCIALYGLDSLFSDSEINIKQSAF
jgi:hypothetical protein